MIVMTILSKMRMKIIRAMRMSSTIARKTPMTVAMLKIRNISKDVNRISKLMRTT